MCSIYGCLREQYARNVCRPHYARFMRCGDYDLSYRGDAWTPDQDDLLLALLHGREPGRRFAHGVLVDTAGDMARSQPSIAQRMQILAKRHHIVRPFAVTE